MLALPNLISLPNDDIDHNELAKTLANVTILCDDAEYIEIIRDNKRVVLPYRTFTIKDLLGSIADLFEAGELNNNYGFDSDYIEAYQYRIMEMFTQKEINNFPLSG